MKTKIYFNWNTGLAWIYRGRLPREFNDDPDDILPITEAIKQYIEPLPDSIVVEE